MENSILLLSYLIGSITFILGLKMLSHPLTARKGNLVAAFGMTITIIATIFLYRTKEGEGLHNYLWIFGGLAIGTIVGTLAAKRVQMTAMPEMVSMFNGMGGACAMLISLIEQHNDAAPTPGKMLIIILGMVIGTISFSGSVIAWGKLNGSIKDKTIAGGQIINFILLGGVLALSTMIMMQGGTPNPVYFYGILVMAAMYGVLFVMPIGGADMPVVVSMLNSYSGWAAAGIGFTLSNSLLIITGALVGASGAILSYIMCKAMNRSLFNVIFGGFTNSDKLSLDKLVDERPVKTVASEDAAFILKNSQNVIIIPGYGMAVAQAQHVVKEMCEALKKHNIIVRFAIHPVAGRMPGHMNVLLAEAGIAYEDVFELEDINRDFSSCDVAFVIGANDITNPAAKTDPDSPIFGMPILEVGQAKTVFFVKRGMSSGYAGVENELFFQNNTMMLFGDAKKVTESILKALEE